MNNELPKIVEVPLTPEEAQQLMQAIKRYSELQDQKIITPKAEAERAGLLQHLQTQLVVHSSEFLGCWIAVTREYQPLVMALRGIFSRANLVMVPRPNQGTDAVVDVEEVKTNA